jgi:hypothetical protein
MDGEPPQRTRTEWLAITIANGGYPDLVSGGNPVAVLEAPGECSQLSHARRSHWNLEENMYNV